MAGAPSHTIGRWLGWNGPGSGGGWLLDQERVLPRGVRLISCHASRIAASFPRNWPLASCRELLLPETREIRRVGPGAHPSYVYMEAVAHPAATGAGAPIATSKMRISQRDTPRHHLPLTLGGWARPVRTPSPARQGASFPAVPPTNSLTIHTTRVPSPRAMAWCWSASRRVSTARNPASSEPAQPVTTRSEGVGRQRHRPGRKVVGGRQPRPQVSPPRTPARPSSGLRPQPPHSGPAAGLRSGRASWPVAAKLYGGRRIGD